MKWKERSVDELADMICGNYDQSNTLFQYRSSSGLTRFFRDADTDYKHDGTTRAAWVASALVNILDEPHPDGKTPPDGFLRIITRLMDVADATPADDNRRSGALKLLNIPLNREGFEAFYAEDNQCYLRHIATKSVVSASGNPHRPFSKQEEERKSLLAAYLDRATEDEFIGDVLLPMLRQVGFHRITSGGHKDKALEFGKDVWMRYQLPTQHVLYFGIQAKKGKLDSAGVTKPGNANMAEILHQAMMMLAHQIFDPELNRKVLVDHAIIAAGGEITKAARHFIGDALDTHKRSQILFMDRNDIINLFIVNNVPLPLKAIVARKVTADDEMPF